VRLQLWGKGPKPGFTTIIAKIVKEEGIKAVYAGLSASIMRQGHITSIIIC
jgi:hypothetical protein